MNIRLFIVTVFAFSLATMAFATHPYQQVRQKRPKLIDTSTSIRSEGGSISVSYTSQPDVVPLNSIHSWTLAISGKDGKPLENAEISVSADMPEHLHGTTTKPKAKTGSKPGQYVIEGMNFHMPGWWEVTLDITGGGTRDLARFHLVLGEGDCPMCKAEPDEVAEAKPNSDR